MSDKYFQGKYICTQEDPWNDGKSKTAIHPDAIFLRESSDSCHDIFQCPYCHVIFSGSCDAL